MTTPESATQDPQPAVPATGAALRWAIRLGAAAAMALSAVLFYESLAAGSALPGCGADSGCGTVLASKWSKVLGVPVAAPAIVVYAAILGAALHIGPGVPESRRRAAWRVLLPLGVVALAAAVYFTGIQLLALGTLCRYCTATHALGLITGLLIVRASPPPRSRQRSAAAIGLVAVAALVVIQTLSPEPATSRIVGGGGAPADLDLAYDTGPGPDREVRLMQGRLLVAPHDYPRVGSADAPLVTVELMDYTCPHCRELHRQLELARAELGDRLVVIVLPTPLNKTCNPLVKTDNPTHAHACELARLGLAVWRAEPGAFAGFHHWMLDRTQSADPDEARARAEAAVGAEALAAALNDPWIDQMLQRGVGLLQMTGGNLPQLITPSVIMYGRPGEPEELIAMLADEPALESAPEPADPELSTTEDTEGSIERRE